MTNVNILDQAVREVTTSRITRVLLLNDLPGAQSLIDAIRTRYREITVSRIPDVEINTSVNTDV